MKNVTIRTSTDKPYKLSFLDVGRKIGLFPECSPRSSGKLRLQSVNTIKWIKK